MVFRSRTVLPRIYCGSGAQSWHAIPPQHTYNRPTDFVLPMDADRHTRSQYINILMSLVVLTDLPHTKGMYSYNANAEAYNEKSDIKSTVPSELRTLVLRRMNSILNQLDSIYHLRATLHPALG